MRLALDEAEAAGARGEVPVGAVVASAEGALLAREGNRVEALHDAGAHAEMLALRAAAAQLGQTRLTGCELWVTLEPCPMCAAAAALFRVRRVTFGAYDPKGGGIAHNARVYERPGSLAVPEVVGGVREMECGELLKQFFKKKR